MGFAEEISDRVYFTEAGLIVEHGSAQEIFSNPSSERTRSFLARALGAPEDGRRVRDKGTFSPVFFDRLKFSV
jgi:polar amino acid transport system ATP-binding protein